MYMRSLAGLVLPWSRRPRRRIRGQPPVRTICGNGVRITGPSVNS